MKYFFLLFLTFNAFANDEVLFSDKAYFRIGNNVYFESDLKTLRKHIQTFKCIHPNSFLLSRFPIQKKQVHKSDLKNYIIFYKILNYLQGQTVIIAPKIKKLMQLSSKQSKCDKSIHNEVFNIMKLEIFIKNRFNDSTFWVSNSEILNEKKTNQDLSEEQIIKNLKANKRDEAIKLFIKNLNNQFEFVKFY